MKRIIILFTVPLIGSMLYLSACTPGGNGNGVGPQFPDKTWGQPNLSKLMQVVPRASRWQWIQAAMLFQCGINQTVHAITFGQTYASKGDYLLLFLFLPVKIKARFF